MCREQATDNNDKAGNIAIITVHRTLHCRPQSPFTHITPLTHASLLKMASSLISVLALTALAAAVDAQTFGSSLTSLSSYSPAISACAVDQVVPSGIDTSIQANNFFPVHAAPVTAGDYWNISYSNTAKLLTNTFTNEQYVLTMRGSAAATNNTLIYNTTKYFAISPTAKYFTIPLQSSCVAETLPVAYLDLLGVRTAISNISGQYVSSSCVQALASQKLVSNYNSTYNSSCNIVFGNTYGNGDFSATTLSNTISLQDTFVKTMLGRAESLKFYAAFFNKEAAAIVIYNR